MAEAEQQPRRQRKPGALEASTADDDVDLEMGNLEADIERRKKKSSYVISEEEIQALRKQDVSHPQKPVVGLIIAVAIACLITVIVVPSAFAGAKPEKPELVDGIDGMNVTGMVPTDSSMSMSISDGMNDTGMVPTDNAKPSTMLPSDGQTTAAPAAKPSTILPSDGQTTAAQADMTTEMPTTNSSTIASTIPIFE